jgi:hypothetical protein
MCGTVRARQEEGLLLPHLQYPWEALEGVLKKTFLKQEKFFEKTSGNT